MSRIRDAPRVTREIVGAVVSGITAHHSFLLASGVAFTAALGLIPALITVAAAYGLVASPADVEANVGGLTGALPEPARELIVTELERLTTTDSTSITIGLAIGLAASIYAVSSVVNAIVMTVRVAHEIPSPHNWIQGRMFALRLSVVAILSTAAALWFIVALPRFADRFDLGGQTETVITVGRWPAVVITSAIAVATLYRLVAGQRGRFLGISIGAIVATGLWVLITWGLAVAYEHIDRLQSTFTTFGAVAALLGWLYFSAVAIVIGAELDHALAKRRRVREQPHPEPPIWLEPGTFVRDGETTRVPSTPSPTRPSAFRTGRPTRRGKR